MQVQVHTDNHVEGRDELVSQVEDEVGAALERFAKQITRVDVHLADENAAKASPDDKRCTIEVRAAGFDPVAVTHHADNLGDARTGATKKLVKALDSRLGRAEAKKGTATIRHEETV